MQWSLSWNEFNEHLVRIQLCFSLPNVSLAFALAPWNILITYINIGILKILSGCVFLLTFFSNQSTIRCRFVDAAWWMAPTPWRRLRFGLEKEKCLRHLHRALFYLLIGHFCEISAGLEKKCTKHGIGYTLRTSSCNFVAMLYALAFLHAIVLEATW